MLACSFIVATAPRREPGVAWGQGHYGMGTTGPATAASTPAWMKDFKAATFRQDEKSLPYRLLAPPDYDPAKKYPLVLLLHGSGERGSDNVRQLLLGVQAFAVPQVRKNHPAFVVVPQCPADRMWVEPIVPPRPHHMAAEPAEPLRLAIELVKSLQMEYSIDPDRLYVTGLSMGGYGVWDAIARWPKMFAAAVPVCGGGDESTAAGIAAMPIWVFHGRVDRSVPVEHSRNMVAALKLAGAAANLRYTEYPNAAHDSWTQAYREKDLLDWLFAQKR